jgi:hypothetical protein
MSNRCTETVKVNDKYVCCDAKWRTNYPFGRKSKGRTTMVREHRKGCTYKKEEKRKRRSN